MSISRGMDKEDMTYIHSGIFSSVQLLSCVRLFATPWIAAGQVSLSFTISCSLLKLMSIESVMPSNHLILCPPLLLLPSVFPSIRVFSNESLHQVAKVLEFQLQHQFFQWYSGLISFRIDWFGLLAVQGTLKKNINSSALSFLTSMRDYWKNHSFD